MTASRTQPLFIDTGAFYARLDENDQHHEIAVDVFGKLRDERVPYRPLYTSHSVLSELATLALRKLGHETAVRGLESIRQSASFTLLAVNQRVFAQAADQFERYDDQQISFVDHTTAVLAEQYDCDHIFAFDGDFTTLGFTRVPHDVDLDV